MESFNPERKSSVNRAVGGDKEYQEGVLELYEELYQNQKKFSNELPKSEDDIQSITAIITYMPDFLLEYGVDPLKVKPDFIHFIDHTQKSLEGEEDLGENVGGAFDQGRQYIIVRIDETDTYLLKMSKVVHELFHAYSFNSVSVDVNYDVTPEEQAEGIHTNVTFGERRVGLALTSRHSAEKSYLNGINEAVTVELEKRFIEKYFKDIPILREEIKFKENALAFQLEQEPDKAEVFKDAEDVIVTKDNETGKETFTTLYYPYRKERSDLKNLIDDIFKNTTEFSSEEEIFKLFANGAINGNLLPIARLINKVYMDRPIPGVETEETMYRGQKRKPFTILAEATASIG